MLYKKLNTVLFIKLNYHISLQRLWRLWKLRVAAQQTDVLPRVGALLCFTCVMDHVCALFFYLCYRRHLGL